HRPRRSGGRSGRKSAVYRHTADFPVGWWNVCPPHAGFRYTAKTPRRPCNGRPLQTGPRGGPTRLPPQPAVPKADQPPRQHRKNTNATRAGQDTAPHAQWSPAVDTVAPRVVTGG